MTDDLAKRRLAHAAVECSTFELRLAFAIASACQETVPQYEYGASDLYEMATLNPTWWLARTVHIVAGDELLRRSRAGSW